MNLIRGTVKLNPTLVEKQNLTQTDVNVILDLHEERLELFEKFEFVPILPLSFVKTMVLDLEEIEFLLQSAWGFKADRDKHSWWYKVPHCICENKSIELYGRPRIINENCPIHSKGKFK